MSEQQDSYDPIEESRRLSQEALNIKVVKPKSLKQVIRELMPDPFVTLDQSLRYRIKRALREQGKETTDDSIIVAVSAVRKETKNGTNNTSASIKTTKNVPFLPPEEPEMSLTDWIKTNVHAKPTNKEERNALIQSVRDAGFQNNWATIYQTMHAALKRGAKRTQRKKRGPYKKKSSVAAQPKEVARSVAGKCNCACTACQLHDSIIQMRAENETLKAQLQQIRNLAGS
jgi:hypothetical protein